MMQELFSSVVAEVAIAIATMIVALVVGYLSRAVHAVLQSSETKRYTEAIERFDPLVADAVRQLARSAVAKVADAADDLQKGEARDWVREHALDYAQELRERTGVKFDPNIVVDKILDAAISEARRSWEAGQRQQSDGLPPGGQNSGKI